ncbi:GxxExxY protein [Candidatus Uhrbacteria bacterium]|nr:GxxExxY protein [Candidatus Uhrbacteria bacterium]
MAEYPHKELTHKIIGAAYKVGNSLGPHIRETYVQRAIAAEFDQLGIAYAREFTVDLCYAGKKIGEDRLDFIVDGKVVVEIKVVPELKNVHLRQVLEYLRVTNMQIALLIFFTPNGVRIRRIVYPDRSKKPFV